MGKKWTCAAAFALAMLVFAGVGMPRAKAQDKEPIAISMYLWDRTMMRQLTPYLEEKFPEIDFTFVPAYNTMDYYKDMVYRGDELPDIITCRRFSLNDAAALSPYLMDLSDTEVAGTFYTSYLDVNKEKNGAIRWLPACAEVDCLVVNKTLFDRNNIPLPTNYAEFVSAVDAFEQLGIQGFRADWEFDYTRLECLQGCAIPELMSFEGSIWRRAYESETDEEQVGLDNVVWPRVFEKFEQFIRDIHYEYGVTDGTYNGVTKPFMEGKTAMIRSTVGMAEAFAKNCGFECVVLPYFGETSKDNWVLTYPMCQFAVSRTVEADDAKREAVMDVLAAVFSQEGQSAMASGATVLSYNKEVHVVPSESMRYAQECVDRNHLYIRLASTETFSVSKKVVSKMLAGELDAKGAYEEYNRLITASANQEKTETFFTQKTAYTDHFGEHGSPAASSFVNTLLAANGQEIAIAYGTVVTEPIYQGDYSLQQFKWLTSSKTDVYFAQYTGAEIRQVMEWLVNVKENGVNPVRYNKLLPITGGMTYTVRKVAHGEYELVDLAVDGQPLDENRAYKVLMVGSKTLMEHADYFNNPIPEALDAKREDAKMGYGDIQLYVDSVAAFGQLLEPADYVTILK